MRLSSRVNRLKTSSTLAVGAKARALKAAGHDVVSFAMGEPDFDTPAHIREAAIKALNEGMTHYMPVPGDMPAREAIASKLVRDNGLDVTAENIIISTGAKQSLSQSLHALVDPGDEVIIPTPSWVSYRPLVGLAGGDVVEVHTDPANDFRMTVAQLRSALSSRSRVLMLCSPGNPTSTMYRPEDLQAIAAIVNEHNRAGGELVVLSDEIYEKLVFTDIQHESIAKFIDGDHAITINGMSKAFAMTGWRLGYAAAPVELVKAMSKLQGQSTTCNVAFTYPALVAALNGDQAPVEQMRRVFQERVEMTYDIVSHWPGVTCARPTGAFYAFPDISAYFGKNDPKTGTPITNSIEFAEALIEATHVAVVPGFDFGPPGENHIRISCAASAEEIKKGLDRIGGFLQSL